LFPPYSSSAARSGLLPVLSPEAIESVFILWRITGDQHWPDSGWDMFKAIQAHTTTEIAHSAIDDVLNPAPGKINQMESFWLAETLKYFYLLYSDTDVISLDDFVL
jgi:mannosyl-oligosaccharide alpha-1,2-mannosidase